MADPGLLQRGAAPAGGLIRGSFSAARLQQGGTGRPSYAFQEAPAPASCERLLNAARAAASRLCTLAFEDSGGANWTSIEHGDLGWSFHGMKPDFYLGLPGVAFALGYVGALTGDEASTRLARLALDGQRQFLAEAPDVVPGIGGFQGWGGVIYCLAHLGALWGDETLLDEAEALALNLGPKIDQDEHNDIIAGTAGCLLALLSLQRVKPSEKLRQLALRCGERLVDAARPRERGLGWVSPIVGPQPIGGLSHGASGISLALFRLWQESGDERFRRTALAGFEFERSLYSPEHRNWIDLRTGAAEMASDEARLYPCGWCHGAPGIGLARVAVLPFHASPEIVEEIEAAVETTLADGFGKNHSLCHGDLGNLDLLIEAARVRRDEALKNRVDRVAGGILQSIEEHGWLYGLPIGAEPLGLMVGLAGIAYELARLAAPDRLPCVLTLSSPPGVGGA